MATIITQRLKLELIKSDDVDDVYDYARDPLVSENTAWTYHKSIEDTKVFIEYVIMKNSSSIGQLNHVWGIQDKQKVKVIGTVSFKQDNEFEGHIDYALGKEYWNKGIITEAVSAVINWVFKNSPSIQHINSGCLSRNIGSVKVLKKIGFKVVGKHTNIRGGKFQNLILETTLFSLKR